jgi:hypothetical protein
VTQIATVKTPSIAQGPRGLPARGLGGVFAPNAGQQDIIDADSFEGPVTELSGTTDIINPQAPGNYIVKTAGVDAMTIAAPRVGLDDNLSISIYSDTANAHTLTGPTTIFANGAATLKTVITFLAFRGSGVTLRAYNGVWQVIGNVGPATFA